MGDHEAKLNTDVELWREPIPPTGLEPAKLFLTREGGIGMNVGGYCVVRPIRVWHQLTHGDVAAYERVLEFLQQERREAEGCTEEMAVLDRVIERVVIMLEVAGNAARKLQGG